jgi:glyoxylase-like metal-dependent hydrolase (beta-lactamase superfamily II)/rhodanese-related sulfurtransferase
MEIKQFEDKNLAHYSYAIISNGAIALIDPSRDPQPYYDFAKQHNAKITTVVETHPHADFVSSHLEIHNTTGATIYVSKLLGAEYPHQTFDDGDAIVLGNITLKSINTPGHSPDSISILAIDENGKPNAVFTGDTLFIGDCGRPDLRETAGAITAAREVLAKQMYHSLHNKLMTLPDDVLVYPAHGAGSLCGKGLSEKNSSSIGSEKLTNWSLQSKSEESFVEELLHDQPFIPKYFTFNVAVNKKGAEPFITSVSKVERRDPVTCQSCVNSLDIRILIIDTRPQAKFKAGHLKNAINLMNDTKFETWLGSIVNPNEPFYLIAENDKDLNKLIERTAKIGYETQIKLAFTSEFGNDKMDTFQSKSLKTNLNDYTIVDIRNDSELKTQKIFEHSIHIPLNELRERINEIPLDKPILVHCAGGYRSAAGSSIIKSKIMDKVKVFDLSEAVKEFI